MTLNRTLVEPLTAALVAALSVTLLACENSPSATAPEGAVFSMGHGEDAPSALHSQVAALGRVTAPFHNFDLAVDAGYSVQITPCLENPGVGAMGFHYGNPAFIDGTVELLEPELLVYEPQRNGRLRLVAVEYIVPFEFVPADADPPMVLGREFHPVVEAGIWGFHVWLWRHNPDGLFADWNPMVSCEFAD